MNTSFQVVGILLAIALLWFGLKKVELGQFPKTVVWVIDFFLLVVATVQLGWLGIWIVILANVIAILALSIRMAMQLEERLTYAATQAGVEKARIQALHKQIYWSDNAFRLLGQQRTADLVVFLSERARSPGEMTAMATPLAKLWVIFRPDLEELVEKFDRLLRLYGDPASKSMRVADTLTRSAQLAAATFGEMLDAAIAVAGPIIDDDG